MTRPTLEFHPDAVEEARAAREWYAARSAAAADRFVAELEHALEQICDGPDQWPKYLHGTRQYTLRRFPYLVLYRQITTAVQVLAVAHARRRPGYWKARTQ
jgi:plasmid stabilization system protein ParE